MAHDGRQKTMVSRCT